MRRKSLGDVVCELTALVRLMDYIEQRSASIYVRDFVHGKLGNYALADLPAPLALKWAFSLLKTCSIPISHRKTRNKKIQSNVAE